METSKKYQMLMLSMVVLVVGLYSNGCDKSDEESSKAGQAYAASVELCTDCGQIKGTELCCKPGQVKCAGCSLVKGSPGCCNIPKGATKAELCAKCGQIKGTEVCCKADQPKCTKCGLAKGSPGCCKIPTK